MTDQIEINSNDKTNAVSFSSNDPIPGSVPENDVFAEEESLDYDALVLSSRGQSKKRSSMKSTREANKGNTTRSTRLNIREAEHTPILQQASGTLTTGNADVKNRNIARRRSYDSTLFGLDVFEGLQVDYQKKQTEESSWKILKFFPIQHPNSKIRRIWDLVSVFVILFSVYTAMYDFAFDPREKLVDHAFVAILDQLSEIFFWADVVFNFFTADYDAEGDIIYNRRRIATNYLSSWLIIDVISNLPLGGGFSLIKGLR